MTKRIERITITEKDNPFINSIKLPDYIDSVLNVSINSIPVMFSFHVNSKELGIVYTGKGKSPSIFDLDVEYFSKSLDRDNKLNSLGI